PTVTITVNAVVIVPPPAPPPETVAAGPQIIAIGSDAGTPSRVRILDAHTGALLADFSPFGAYAGGVRVAVGDLTGDGADDIAVATAGGIGFVEVLDGRTLAPVAAYLPFGLYPSGLQIAAGDVAGHRRADLRV